MSLPSLSTPVLEEAVIRARSMSLAVANFERVLCVEFAEFAAVVKIAAEFGARHGGVGEVALAVGALYG